MSLPDSETQASTDVNNITSHSYTSSWLHLKIRTLLSVKFGRMSKKQREKVEDEVRFHRAQLRAQTETACDSSVFDTQMPSSSDQHQTNFNGYSYNSDLGSYTTSHTGYSYASTPVTTAHQTMAYDISADYVDSTTAYDPRPGQALDTPLADSALIATTAGFVDSTTFLSSPPAPSNTRQHCGEEPPESTTVHPNPAQISELLSKTIADAHARTCLFPLDHIHEMFRKPQDISKLFYYKNMVGDTGRALWGHIRSGTG
uniref:Uncharacterized protein n=1 Tax=Timema shepardi TaxID=629360 RepID=A0A7R9ALR2_TIMSH|nr:unnamed protein product [Timema shepardi]